MWLLSRKTIPTQEQIKDNTSAGEIVDHRTYIRSIKKDIVDLKLSFDLDIFSTLIQSHSIKWVNEYEIQSSFINNGL